MTTLNRILFATVLGFSGSLFARDISAADMEANFQACTARSPYWTQRWGKYIVAFERNQAMSTCRDQYWNSEVQVKTAGCRLDGSWKTAGFYCEERSPGGGE